MSVDILAIRKELDRLEEDLIARVPEHLFVEHLLPIIAGDDGHSDMQVWEHLTGSVFNRLHVIDPAGNILFTLPPIAVSPKTSVDRDSKTSMFEIMSGYEARTLLSPIYAKRYMDESIKDKVIRQDRNWKQILLIDDVLIRYGRKPHLPAELRALIEGRAAPKSTTSQTNDTSEFGEVGDDL
jgi:hypothetical protein